MIITPDEKSSKQELQSPIPHSNSAPPPQLQLTTSEPIEGNYQEYAELPPAYESVVDLNISDAPRSSSPQLQASPSGSNLPQPSPQHPTRDASIRSLAKEKPQPEVFIGSAKTIQYPPTSSIQPHYYSPDSYGAPVPRTSATKALLSTIGEKLTPPVHNPATLIPSSFVRTPPPGLGYDLFRPTYLVDLGGLQFPMRPPPSQLPHPFVTHDVNEMDWKRCGPMIRHSLSPR